ncbi:protein of unknown function [Nitrosotalea devaniterrae]|uniref:Uncharacterized protein n=1 Tax=Nitrosotalea devaniterrae TaxID=1078905 RepID=A0A128A233_9ARCH|nr:protein of unknown function [Candidatus Nitrosotalea devanaterra]
MLNSKGEYLSSELSLDEMWKKIEDYGIDRKLLEATHPSNELLFQLYTAITKVNEEIHAMTNNDSNISQDFVQPQ